MAAKAQVEGVKQRFCVNAVWGEIFQPAFPHLEGGGTGSTVLRTSISLRTIIVSLCAPFRFKPDSGQSQIVGQTEISRGNALMKGCVGSVLVVDDFPQWRRVVGGALLGKLGLRTIAEAGDGLEAVGKAEALQPDLVVLDIGLPTLNGIEAARRIRGVSPKSKVVFLTQNCSSDVAEAALDTGAGAYVVKSAFARELIPAVEAVLEGRRFLSDKLTAWNMEPA